MLDNITLGISQGKDVLINDEGNLILAGLADKVCGLFSGKINSEKSLSLAAKKIEEKKDVFKDSKSLKIICQAVGQLEEKAKKYPILANEIQSLSIHYSAALKQSKDHNFFEVPYWANNSQGS